jgi:hypothetical protein
MRGYCLMKLPVRQAAAVENPVGTALEDLDFFIPSRQTAVL